MINLETQLCAALGIEHPVLLAPMDIVSGGRLAAAVTEAGGLGIIGGGYGDEAWLNEQFDLAQGARVGVGFITWSLSRTPRLLDVVLEHKPAVVMLSFGDAGAHIARIKRAGIPVLCQVQTGEMAREAVEQGADIIVAQGAEAGGHGVACGTFTLVPTVVEAIRAKVPVVAAGGIADGRGLAAALCLGASGVLVGTRFYASLEADGHPLAKQRIVAAKGGEDTVRSIVCDIARNNVWPAPFNGRVLRNEFVNRWFGREKELLQLGNTEARDFAAARARGDFDIAAVIAGEASGLIHSVLPAQTIVADMVAGARAILNPHGAAVH